MIGAGNVARVVALLLAAVNTGGLVVLMALPKGMTGFAVPWRYWGAAAGLLIEVSGVYARISLWGDVLSWRDIVFLAINACITVAVFGLILTTNEEEAPSWDSSSLHQSVPGSASGQPLP